MRTDRDNLRPEPGRIGADLEELSRFVAEDRPGWTRQVLTEPYARSRGWVEATMREAGLQVRRDAAGNLIGVLPGTRGGGPALATGSHTDTVESGGRFDGIVGVLGAIEVARRLQETGTRLRHDLVVVDFLGEEPNEYGVSCIGSRSIAGTATAEYFASTRASGSSLGDDLEKAGMSPSAMASAAWPAGTLAGFVELHIEQGPVLGRTGTEIGVVTTIAGIERVLATFTGRSDHAGTTLMADRRDALVAAAEAVLAVEQIGCSAPDAVATVGALEVRPGALNVVPSHARMWTELRSPSPEWLGTARARVVDDIVALAGKRGVELDVTWLNDQDPVPMATSVQDHVARAAGGLGYSWRAMPSGAGHDAAHIAALAPTGMIFVQSRDGRSHCPEEWTDPEAVEAGAHVLAATLVELDER